MGVAGLHAVVAPACRSATLAQLRGLLLAIDVASLIFAACLDPLDAPLVVSGARTSGPLVTVMEVLERLQAAASDLVVVFDRHSRAQVVG